MNYKDACSTKVKREALASDIKALAETLGCEFRRDPFNLERMEPREVACRLDWRDFWVFVEFKGDSRIGAFLAHWNSKQQARYPAEFGWICRGSVNTCTFDKATTCVGSFDELKAALTSGFQYLQRAAPPSAVRATRC